MPIERMQKTITVRLPKDLADWLRVTARKRGASRGRVIREQLEKAGREEVPPFLFLAGAVSGSTDFSMRKGLSRQ